MAPAMTSACRAPDLDHCWKAQDALSQLATAMATRASREPMVTIEEKDKPSVKYVDLDPEKAKKIFSEHVLGGNVVKEYVLAAGSERTL